MSTTATATKTCRCGCNAPVARTYLPGHDAKHKGALKAAVLAGGLAGERAAWTMIDLGWGRFAPQAALVVLPSRNRRGQVRFHVEAVATFLVDQTGTHHARANCSCMTAAAKAAGQVHPITKLARPSFFQTVASTPALVATLVRSFDQCPECLIDETAFEMVERTTTLRAWVQTSSVTAVKASLATEVVWGGHGHRR